MAATYPTITAAAVQASSVFLDRERTIEKAGERIEEAGAAGADLVVFPEGFVPGHPRWFEYHPVQGPVTRELNARLFANALPIPGAGLERLESAAAAADTFVVLGASEKVPGTTGTLYNSQLYLSPDDGLVGKHQKLRPTLGERLVHADGGAETFGAVEASFGPVSGLLCGENANPFAIAGLLADYPVVHAASWPATFHQMPQWIVDDARAFIHMAKAFVVAAAGTIDDRTVDLLRLDDEEAEAARSEERSGGSIIVAPDGTVVAGPAGTEETILYGELDLERCVERKQVHDYAGHYNRSDVFELRIDGEPRQLVSRTPATTGRRASSATEGRSDAPAAPADDPGDGSD